MSIAALITLGLLGSTTAQRQVHKGTKVTIEAESLEYDLTTDVLVMAGGCSVAIADAAQTRMSAPKVTITPEEGENRVISVEAQGPVSFSRIIDPGNADRRLKASCSQRATFSERSGLGSLIGSVRVTVTETPDKGDVATINGNSLEFSLDGGDLQLDGDCDVTIAGANNAHMTASAITLVPNSETQSVASVEARGPVTLDATIVREDGQKRRVQAKCSEVATYSEDTMVAEMVGDVHVEVTSVPETEGIEATTFDTSRMTLDLKNGKFKLGPGANIEAEMVPDAFKGETEETE